MTDSETISALRTALQQCVEALERAVHWAKIEANGRDCPTCDPGGEGPEIWSELAVEFQKPLAAARKVLVSK